MSVTSLTKAVLLLVLLLTSLAVAQKKGAAQKAGAAATSDAAAVGEKADAAGGKSDASSKYDPATETTLKGVVQEVKEVPNSCMGETGVHLMVKTAGGNVEVQVAPVDFLNFMEVTFAKGNEVEIIASQVAKEGGALLLAREVSLNNNQVVVRDKKGVPVWTWMKKGQSSSGR